MKKLLFNGLFALTFICLSQSVSAQDKYEFANATFTFISIGGVKAIEKVTPDGYEKRKIPFEKNTDSAINLTHLYEELNTLQQNGWEVITFTQTMFTDKNGSTTVFLKRKK